MTKNELLDSLDAFTRSYIETLLWSEMDQSDENTGGDPLDRNYSEDDLTVESIREIARDCRNFQDYARESLDAVYGLDLGRHSTPEYAGHNFCLTRQGHGAGFWDGDYPEPYGRLLTDASKTFGSFYTYVHGGRVHVS